MKGDVNILQKEGETRRVLGQQDVAACRGGQPSRREAVTKVKRSGDNRLEYDGKKLTGPGTGVLGDFKESVMHGLMGSPWRGRTQGNGRMWC